MHSGEGGKTALNEIASLEGKGLRCKGGREGPMKKTRGLNTATQKG